ncbi:unnamed protein product [Prunus armeniaca]
MTTTMIMRTSRIFFSKNHLGLFHGSSQSSNQNPSKSKSRDPQHPFDVTNLGDASNMFDKMLKQGRRPSVVRFTQLLGQVAKLKHYSVVISWYKQITLLGVVPDAFILNIIVNCFGRLNQMDASFSVLALFFKLGLQPDVTTFNTLIRGLGLDNRVHEAASLVRKMAFFGEGCKPNVITFGTLIDASCKLGQNGRAIQLLRLMEKYDCQPNVVVYSTIIDSLCKDQLVAEAFKLFSEMESKCIPPNIVTYTSLFLGLCKSCPLTEATQFFTEMSSKGISPNVQTFSILVDSLCKNGKLKEANQAIDLMTARGMEPNTFTYNCLMKGYCLQRDMNKAKGIFDLMLKKGSIVDVFSYTILINGYCNKRRMKEAMHLFEEMTRKGMIPDTVTYTTLIGGFCKDRRIDDAQNIFSKMKVGGPLPNISTYSVLLDGLCRNGHIDMALKFFGELECSNVDFGISPYNILIDGLCMAGRLESARDLFRSLPSKGLKPDVKTYTILIITLSTKGLFTEAEALLRGMEEKGCSPDSVTYNTIIQRFLLNDELSRAQKLIQEMVAKGFYADDLTTTMIVDLIDEGKLDTDLHPVEKKNLSEFHFHLQMNKNFLIQKRKKKKERGNEQKLCSEVEILVQAVPLLVEVPLKSWVHFILQVMVEASKEIQCHGIEHQISSLLSLLLEKDGYTRIQVRIINLAMHPLFDLIQSRSLYFAARDMHTFLLKWYEKFTFARLLSPRPVIWNRGLTIMNECDFDNYVFPEPQNVTVQCNPAISQANKIVGEYVIVDVCCPSIVQQELRLQKMATKISVGGYVCMTYERRSYLNLSEIQKAVHTNRTNFLIVGVCAVSREFFLARIRLGETPMALTIDATGILSLLCMLHPKASISARLQSKSRISIPAVFCNFVEAETDTDKEAPHSLSQWWLVPLILFTGSGGEVA